MENLKQEILTLIELKQEGEYWDFKKQWYDSKKKSDLLLDIICMANNLSTSDGYIIIGVDEENGYNIKDISEDENRKSTQNLVDFLKNKKFVGEIRPVVYIETLQIQKSIIDVIVIKNTKSTPYYLTEKFQDIISYNIYTRIQDTNTAKDKSADIDKVEFLWKKRFGLLSTPIEKLESFFDLEENWVTSITNETSKYYKFHPEYTISYDNDMRKGYEYYHFFQTDFTPSFINYKFNYHQTVLKEVLGISLDGGRYLTPCPETDGVSFSSFSRWDITFKYFERDSFLFRFNKFLYNSHQSDDARIARDNFLSCVLLFDDANQRNQFKKYIETHWNEENKKYEPLVNPPHIPEQPQNYRKEYFDEQCKNILVLQKMFFAFKNNK